MMQPPKRIVGRSANWRGKGLARVLLLIVAAIAIAALASIFGIARDYGYLRASLLTGIPGGRYHTLGTSLAARASRGHGSVTVVPTAGSVENVRRLAENRRPCTAMFAFVQDGTPVPADAELEVLGRLPETESILLLGRRDRTFSTFADLRGASIGIGPQGSGTAYLMRQLFEDQDLRDLNVHLTPHELPEQTDLVAQGHLDLAAVVMAEDAEFIRNVFRQYDLDIVAPREIEGLVKRHPWLELGRIPAGRYDVKRPIPSTDRVVAHVDTLVVTDPCARRAERVALLTLLSAELPGFVRSNPPRSTDSATALPLAPEARQFFVAGEPEIADRYFPWLVNLMSPVYWVYLVMAVTVLFNAMRGFSRFRLWRIDAAREKLKTRINELTGPEFSRERKWAGVPSQAPVEPQGRAIAQDIMEKLTELRMRCQRYTGSVVTPMGDEMFYRYQESLIDEMAATLAAAVALKFGPISEAAPRPIGGS
jgi:TRAP transporter TAXI family solute receptor